MHNRYRPAYRPAYRARAGYRPCARLRHRAAARLRPGVRYWCRPPDHARNLCSLVKAILKFHESEPLLHSPPMCPTTSAKQPSASQLSTLNSQLPPNHTTNVHFHTTFEETTPHDQSPDPSTHQPLASQLSTLNPQLLPKQPSDSQPSTLNSQLPSPEPLNSQPSTLNQLWHRQPNEPAADYQLFTAWLQLPAPRKFTKAAPTLGSSVHRLRRLAAQHDWRARTAAFDNYRADASNRALDQLLQDETTDWKSRAERFRQAEWALHEQMVEVASALTEEIRKHPNRVSFNGMLQLIDLSSKLGRRATNMPLEYVEPKPDPLAGTYLSFEEALNRVYGPASQNPQP